MTISEEIVTSLGLPLEFFFCGYKLTLEVVEDNICVVYVYDKDPVFIQLFYDIPTNTWHNDFMITNTSLVAEAPSPKEGLLESLSSLKPSTLNFSVNDLLFLELVKSVPKRTPEDALEEEAKWRAEVLSKGGVLPFPGEGEKF